MIIKPFNGVFWGMYGIGLLYFAVMWYWGRNKSRKERKNALLAAAISLIAVFAVYKYFLLTDPEYYQITVDAGVPLPDPWQELPLNGCNLCMLLLPVALLSGSDSLISLCAIVGVFLPIIPTITPVIGFEGYSIFTPRILGFYVTHIFVLYNGCLLYAYGFFRPTMKHIYKTVIVCCLILVSVHILNLLLIASEVCPGANYCYTLRTNGNALLETVYRWIPIPCIYLFPLLGIVAGLGAAEAGLYRFICKLKGVYKT